jgi:hypothetical protein
MQRDESLQQWHRKGVDVLPLVTTFYKGFEKVPDEAKRKWVSVHFQH